MKLIRGDFFQEKYGEVYMLAQVDFDTFCLVSLRDGNRWKEPVRVKNDTEVTAEEKHGIFGDEEIGEFKPVKIKTKIIQQVSHKP